MELNFVETKGDLVETKGDLVEKSLVSRQNYPFYNMILEAFWRCNKALEAYHHVNKKATLLEVGCEYVVHNGLTPLSIAFVLILSLYRYFTFRFKLQLH